MKKEEGRAVPTVEREVKPATSRLADAIMVRKKMVSFLAAVLGAGFLLLANWLDPALLRLAYEVVEPYAKPAVATWVSTPDGAKLSRMEFLNTKLITTTLASGAVSVPMAITVSRAGRVVYTVTGGLHSKGIFDDADIVITGHYDFEVNYDFAVEKQFDKPFLLEQLGIHSPGNYWIQLTACDVFGNVLSTASLDFVVY